jgi:cobalt-zinc-cadmium efflux system protein
VAVDPAIAATRARQRRSLVWVLAANATFFVVELVGGLVFGSLALLADAFHMASDVVAMTVALIAHSLSTRPSSARHSFGLQRAEVLGAQANGVILVAGAGWITVEAIRRLGDAPEVAGGGLLVVAVLGLALNGVSALVLVRHAAGSSLNTRGVLLHVATDAAGSVGAIGAGLAIVLTGTTWPDPAISLAIAALVLISAWRLLRDTTHVLLEGTPRNLRPDEVIAALGAVPGVVGVHHLHLWSLASDTPALSAHVVLEDNLSLHEAQGVGDRLRALLAERFTVTHATLELECHLCETPPAVADLPGPPRPRRRPNRSRPPAVPARAPGEGEGRDR